MQYDCRLQYKIKNTFFIHPRHPTKILNLIKSWSLGVKSQIKKRPVFWPLKMNWMSKFYLNLVITFWVARGVFSFMKTYGVFLLFFGWRWIKIQERFAELFDISSDLTFKTKQLYDEGLVMTYISWLGLVAIK